MNVIQLKLIIRSIKLITMKQNNNNYHILHFNANVNFITN